MIVSFFLIGQGLSIDIGHRLQQIGQTSPVYKNKMVLSFSIGKTVQHMRQNIFGQKKLDSNSLFV